MQALLHDWTSRDVTQILLLGLFRVIESTVLLILEALTLCKRRDPFKQSGAEFFENGSILRSSLLHFVNVALNGVRQLKKWLQGSRIV